MFEILVYVPFMSLWAIPLYVPEDTPAIVTLSLVECRPWFLWNTLIIPVPLNVLNGFVPNVLTGKCLLAKVNVPVWLVVNEAFFNLNFKSSNCSALQVLLFADLNNIPVAGCFDTVLSELKFVPPNLAT